jgi:hypothetical protein
MLITVASDACADAGVAEAANAIADPMAAAPARALKRCAFIENLLSSGRIIGGTPRLAQGLTRIEAKSFTGPESPGFLSNSKRAAPE